MQEIVNKERNSSLELLRIISMLLIVTAHFSVHGDYPKSTIESFGFNNIVLQILGSYAYVGVEAFMLITGYFMVTSLKSNYRKAVKMITDILFYSVSFLVVCWVFKLLPLSKTDIFGSLIPWGYYWFVTNYVLILLIAPFLNLALLKLSKKQYTILLLVLIIATRLLPFVLLDHYSIKTGTIDYFLLFYLIGGYIRQYIPRSETKGKYLAIAISMFFLVSLIDLTVDYVGLRMNKVELLGKIHYLGLDTIPVDICAVALFLYFRSFDMKNRFVNGVARYTLDVYLIHENRLIMKLLWGGLLSGALIYSKWFTLLALLEICAVYIGCTLIGWCKHRTWDVFFEKVLYGIENRFVKKTNSNAVL